MSTYATTPLHSTIREANPVASGGTTATSKPTLTAGTGDDARLKEAAVQFEAVFVRQMLSSLEKATGSPTGNQTSGGSIYGSMVVNSVADAVAHAGGLGLGSMLLRSLSAQGSSNGSHDAEPKFGHQDFVPAGVAGSTRNARIATPEESRELSPLKAGRPL